MNNDIIDTVLYQPEPEPISRIDVINAYKKIFKGPYAEIVIRDLINTSTYGSDTMPVEPPMAYHLIGQRQIIKHIKDILNEVVTQAHQEEEAKMQDYIKESTDG